MNAEVARTDLELRMTEQLVDCAHGLAMSFGEAARAEAGLDRNLKLFDAFHRSFQAVRLGIRLCLTLRAPPAQPAARPAALETEVPQRDERPEPREPVDVRPEREREREGDYEPVSLKKFLATLRGVAADAERLPIDCDPAILPRLNALLAQAEPQGPAAEAAVMVRPAPSAPQRSRLMGSAARPLDLGRPRPPPHPSG